MLSPARLEEEGIREQVKQYASSLRGNCLDVGCRTKPYAEEIRPFVSRHFGIDIARLNKPSPLGPDVIGSALLLPFRNESFDSVLCTQVLDDTPDPLLALKEIARVLRSDGIVMLTVPQSWGEHDLPHDYWRFTEPGLRYLMKQAGFVVEVIERRGGVGAVISQRLSAFLYYTWGRRLLPLRVLVVAACAVIQLMGQVVDLLDRQRADTLGFAVVARNCTFRR